MFLFQIIDIKEGIYRHTRIISPSSTSHHHRTLLGTMIVTPTRVEYGTIISPPHPPIKIDWNMKNQCTSLNRGKSRRSNGRIMSLLNSWRAIRRGKRGSWSLGLKEGWEWERLGEGLGWKVRRWGTQCRPRRHRSSTRQNLGVMKVIRDNDIPCRLERTRVRVQARG